MLASNQRIFEDVDLRAILPSSCQRDLQYRKSYNHGVSKQTKLYPSVASKTLSGQTQVGGCVCVCARARARVRVCACVRVFVKDFMNWRQVAAGENGT